ncbi:MAG: translation initiation factor IF-2 [Nanohaloarchaea archaeon SW_7_43_1]|nr:MAG: translation initiation factor IF-2 [Nanohaloarchaea archaeon SW_7_43_1]
MPRQPILSVLGHTDAGKTSLLDKIRESEITEDEEGSITQMIGATEVPIQTVENVCGDLLGQLDTELTIPGILFIDTPGHAAFSSLRKRGGSISDIAIVVVDVTEGIQPQTEEALQILQDSGTPFVIAFNKIDTLHGWNSKHQLFTKNIKQQNERNVNALDEKIYELMSDLHEEVEVTADRFDRVESFQKKAAIVPISAKTGEGIPELLMVVTGLAQKYLGDNLEVNEGMGKGTVLEVSQEKGLGTTTDVIHYDGIIDKEDKMVYGTSNGVKTTDIRALMCPRPLEEIRLDEKYERVEKMEPASGIKIAGKDLEAVVSGAPIRTASENELDAAIEEVEEELESVEFDTQRQGVAVKADSLGSLEAVMREIEDIDVQKAEVGNVTKSDIIEVENEKPEERAIFVFNTRVTDQARQMALDKGVKIFQSKVIYEIFENYTEWKDELKEKQKKEALNSIARPAKIRSIPDHVFNRSKPAVVGVKVVDGILTAGSSVMTLKGDRIGKIKSVQAENQTLDKAEKGQEVAVSISNATVGRDFEEGDTLIVNINGREYKQLRELKDFLTAGEEDVLEEIIEIKDEEDPHWKLG